MTVPAGQQLTLMVVNEVSTRAAKPGDRFLLKLAQPVMAGGSIVLPKGTRAWGEVIDARANGMTGKAGKLSVRLLHIDFNGLLLPIRGDATRVGQNGSLQIVLATAALTPWGLFARGNNAKLKAGDLVDAYLETAFVPPSPGQAFKAPPPPPVAQPLPDDGY